MTFFHKHIITGPIHSRRLGISLGVNLLPITEKLCNYDCVYCECGWDTRWEADPAELPTLQEIEEALRASLQKLKTEGTRPDSITFSGNGEPTIHPQFPQIAPMTAACAREFYPENPPLVTVISNATQIGRPEIVEALGHCTKVLLKLDAGTPQIYARINQLQKGFKLGAYEVKDDPESYYPQLLRNLENYPHPFTMQTLLFRGEHDGKPIDNTSGAEWEAYVQRLQRIKPSCIMLYGLDRETPAKALKKLSKEELEAHAEELRKAGFPSVQAFF